METKDTLQQGLDKMYNLALDHAIEVIKRAPSLEEAIKDIENIKVKEKTEAE